MDFTGLVYFFPPNFLGRCGSWGIRTPGTVTRTAV